jgi:hypothetical protein
MMLLAIAGAVRAFRVTTICTSGEKKCETPGYIWSFAFMSALLLAFVGSGMYGASHRYRWPLEYAFFPFAALAIYSLVHITRITLVSRWKLATTIRPETKWLRCLRIGFPLLIAVILCVYIGGLVTARIRAKSDPEFPVRNSLEDVLDTMEEGGITSEFNKQDPKWITISDVFDQMAENFGEVTTYDGRLIVWWGRIILPQNDDSDRLRQAYFAINPRRDTFGGIKLPIYTAERASIGITGLKHDDIVTVVARIMNIKGLPKLKVYAIMDGRSDIPVEDDTD